MGTKGLSHSVTLYSECELGFNGVPCPAGLMVKKWGGSKAFPKIIKEK